MADMYSAIAEVVVAGVRNDWSRPMIVGVVDDMRCEDFASRSVKESPRRRMNVKEGVYLEGLLEGVRIAREEGL